MYIHVYSYEEIISLFPHMCMYPEDGIYPKIFFVYVILCPCIYSNWINAATTYCTSVYSDITALFSTLKICCPSPQFAAPL